MTPTPPPQPNKHPATAASTPDRRQWLLAGLGLATLPARAATAHAELGPVRPPLTPPPLILRLHNGRHQALQAMLRGQVTAVQLMFTGCSATCPLQGAIFGAVERALQAADAAQAKKPNGPDHALAQAQLLSISIQPLVDDPAALAAWRQRFGAGDRWLVGAPPTQHASVMLDFLGAASGNPSDRHTAQTHLFDAQGRLAYRLAPLAGADAVIDAMRALAAQKSAG